MGANPGQARCLPVVHGRFSGVFKAEPKPPDSDGLYLSFKIGKLPCRCPSCNKSLKGELFANVLVSLTNQDVAGLRDYFT